MTSVDLLNRSLGTLTPIEFTHIHNARLLEALQLQSWPRFGRSTKERASSGQCSVAGSSNDGGSRAGEGDGNAIAHRTGVNTIAIDRFEGRYLLSGGADSSISIWDLEVADLASPASARFEPLGTIGRTSSDHKFGVSSLSFYPFDSLAFLSSSYDHTLKLYSSDTLAVHASFDLGSIVYSHAVSTIAQHLLVACASQQPAVRLVDLRSGASTHSLVGHKGSVLAVSWSPVAENILASGATDGTVRLWDIRRSSSSLGCLDMEDHVGVVGHDGFGTGARHRESGKAHAAAVNGLSWTEPGDFLVTTGHDERIRVWDMLSGANTLANFGPIVRNTHLSTINPLLAPAKLLGINKQVLFFQNESEILVYNLLDGELLKRIRGPAAILNSGDASVNLNQRNIQQRVTSLAWRAHDVELYSSYVDGSIHCWNASRLCGVAGRDVEQDSDGPSDSEDTETKKRKRQILDDIYQGLTKQRVTFT